MVLFTKNTREFENPNEANIVVAVPLILFNTTVQRLELKSTSTLVRCHLSLRGIGATVLLAFNNVSIDVEGILEGEWYANIYHRSQYYLHIH